MPKVKCQYCNEWIHYRGDDIDINHTCRSGKEILDNIDLPDITKVNIKLASSVKNYGKPSWYEGDRDYDTTSRGNRTSTHTTERREYTLKLKEDK